MFATTSVVFRIPESFAENDFGEVQTTFRETVVDGCLYSPKKTSDDKFPAIYSDKTVVRVDIPKEFDEVLSNAILKISSDSPSIKNRWFRVIGNPIGLDPSNTPGDWNRFVLAVEINEDQEV